MIILNQIELSQIEAKLTQRSEPRIDLGEGIYSAIANENGCSSIALRHTEPTINSIVDISDEKSVVIGEQDNTDGFHDLFELVSEDLELVDLGFGRVKVAVAVALNISGVREVDALVIARDPLLFIRE